MKQSLHFQVGCQHLPMQYAAIIDTVSNGVVLGLKLPSVLPGERLPLLFTYSKT